jgi:dsRNA-specific ribonuclease
MNMNKPTALETLKGIYLGDRGEGFRTLIKSVLNIGAIKDRYVDILTSDENMKLYGDAFTSELVDENNNYQVYEQLGDLTGNKFIVWYIYDRFPQLRCAEGVKVAARLRINYGSKQTFSDIAEKLGFWPFVSATNDLRQRVKKSLLEDVFEAFLGVTEMILDADVTHGVGYACVYSILAGIFDGIDISLEYEDLYDSKTRLKELFDLHGAKLGPLVYEDSKNGLISESIAYHIQGANYEVRPDGSVNQNRIVPNPGERPKKVMIGMGSASLKADAQQEASKMAIKNLAKQGYEKKPPLIYAKFSKKYTPRPTGESDVLRICESKDRINEQFYTRGKSKNHTVYTSTPLAMYCRKRDYQGIKTCLEMGADPNVPDSEGLSAVDLLLIGEKNEKLVSKVLPKFVRNQPKLVLSKQVFDVYYSKYEDVCREYIVVV